MADHYICNECEKVYGPWVIYNIMGNYFICYLCLAKKLVGNLH